MSRGTDNKTRTEDGAARKAQYLVKKKDVWRPTGKQGRNKAVYQIGTLYNIVRPTFQLGVLDWP